jgi:hypothetical protein
MPEVKVLAPAKDFTGIVRDQNDKVVQLNSFIGRRIKRATRVGNRVAVHLVKAPPGELLVFETPGDYERVILREFVPS